MPTRDPVVADPHRRPGVSADDGDAGPRVKGLRVLPDPYRQRRCERRRAVVDCQCLLPWGPCKLRLQMLHLSWDVNGR